MSKKLKRKLKNLSNRVLDLELKFQKTDILGDLITTPFGKLVDERWLQDPIKPPNEVYCELVKKDQDKIKINPPEEEKKYPTALRYFESLSDDDFIKKTGTDSFTYDQLINFAEKYYFNKTR